MTGMAIGAFLKFSPYDLSPPSNLTEQPKATPLTALAHVFTYYTGAALLVMVGVILDGIVRWLTRGLNVKM